MGVELTHHIADHAGAFVEGSVRTVAAIVHRVDHTAVHRLEAVTHIRQGTTDNNRHRIVQVGTLHFSLQVHLLNVTVVVYAFSTTIADYVNLGGLILVFFAHNFLICLCPIEPYTSFDICHMGYIPFRARYQGNECPWRSAE